MHTMKTYFLPLVAFLAIISAGCSSNGSSTYRKPSLETRLSRSGLGLQGTGDQTTDTKVNTDNVIDDNTRALEERWGSAPKKEKSQEPAIVIEQPAKIAEEATPKTTPKAIADGLEKTNSWLSTTWAWPTTANVVEGKEFEGEGKVLLLTLQQLKEGEKNDKAAIQRKFAGKVSRISFNADNISKGSYSVAVAVNTADAYYESPLKVLSKGWNRDIVFDANQKYWKSKASGWQNNQSLPDSESTLITILIYNPDKGLKIAIDSLYVK
ncbi:MAG: hypothetical protein JXR97_17175 [Planctomycetes bacterium]|nr:hypothetical protein [Planctomycetota bacterium]